MNFHIQVDGGPRRTVRCGICRAAIDTVGATIDEALDGSDGDVSIEDVEIDNAMQVKCPTCDTRFDYGQVQSSIREYHRKLGEQLMIDMNQRLLKKSGASLRKTPAKSFHLTGPFVIE